MAITKGPWRIDMEKAEPEEDFCYGYKYETGHGRTSGAIVGADGTPVLYFDPSEEEYSVALDHKSDDARIIVAAPELLALCQATLDWLDELKPGQYFPVLLAAAMSDIIRKLPREPK